MIKFELPEKLTTFDFDKLLKETEIIKGTQYDKPTTLFELPFESLKGTELVPVMTSGNLSAIQGKAKSRKTFFLVLASSLIISQKNIKIVIFDTEQYNYHSSQMLWRINKLSPINNLRLFNLRKYSIDVRLEFMETYILQHKPELVFIDNIRDCMMDINSWVETNKVLTTFTQLADEYKTHICFTLHENPSKETDKARGAIGTELQNKCETILQLKKEENTTLVKGLFTRNKDFTQFCFSIDENGLPRFTSQLNIQEDVF